MGYGIWDRGRRYGIWDRGEGYGIGDKGYELWDRG